MISVLFYLLKRINDEIEPYDVAHSSFNLYDKKNGVAFVFDGDVSRYKDTDNLVIIHLDKDEPNEKYYNYYIDEVSVKSAINILFESGYDIEPIAPKIVDMEYIREQYHNACVGMENKYKTAIVEYLNEDDNNIFPINGYKELLCENWFKMQRSWYTISYKFKNRECEVINDTSPWGEWGKYYSAALRYSIIHNTTTIPVGTELGGLKIRVWLGEQTTAFRKGYLQPEREAIIRKAGFKLEAFKENWDEMYRLLLEYKLETGNTDIEKRDKYKDQNLGLWCRRQRKVYMDGNMTQERANKLESIGFVWDPLEKEWNRRYEQYKRYIMQHNGNVYIARRTDFESEHLGAWVETQRKRYFEGKVSEERINKLKLLGVDFEKWDELVQQNT